MTSFGAIQETIAYLAGVGKTHTSMKMTTVKTVSQMQMAKVRSISLVLQLELRRLFQSVPLVLWTRALDKNFECLGRLLQT